MRKPNFLRAKEYKTMADHNAKLCADLVEECNSQGKIIDELSDENDRLKEQIQSYLGAYRDAEQRHTTECCELKAKIRVAEAQGSDCRNALYEIYKLLLPFIDDGEWDVHYD